MTSRRLSGVQLLETEKTRKGVRSTSTEVLIKEKVFAGANERISWDTPTLESMSYCYGKVLRADQMLFRSNAMVDDNKGSREYLLF